MVPRTKEKDIRGKCDEELVPEAYISIMQG